MKFVEQHDQSDCGPACLSMISNYYGKNYDLEYLRKHSFISRDGVSLFNIDLAAQEIGFDTFSTKLSITQLVDTGDQFPCIIHWNRNHFVVLKKITTLFSQRYYHILDPMHGAIRLNEEKFISSWISDNNAGVVMLLAPLDKFYFHSIARSDKRDFSHLIGYFKSYKAHVGALFFMLLLGSCLNFVFPFLTQNLIDKGVNVKNINTVEIILFSQLILYFGLIISEVVRNWLMLYLGTKISVNIISDFLGKLLKLPLRFFDSKMMGDFYQRINDNERIEKFLTSQSLITFFSLITFLVFFVVLMYYDFGILLIYALLTIASLFWSFYWLRKRKMLDYYRFQQKGQNQENIYEILNGVSEMKLNQFEDYKRKQWEKLQDQLFNINMRILKVDQMQISGFDFFNQIKNILVTFIAATLVIRNNMTLGELLAISYIIGQLNSPVYQLVDFFRSMQDAKLSLERLNEVHYHPNEAAGLTKKLNEDSTQGIELINLSFQYEGPRSPFVLNNINLSIQKGKMTAIVGASGSGKSTLMKLLLRFYEPTSGLIKFNGDDILTLSPKSIRERCGVVMQDGYIFSDTILRNIITGDHSINEERLERAIDISNIRTFIHGYPLGYNTKIGAAGNNISGGQKQRILIARAIYKDPQYILFDEATSSLDAQNEKVIHDNLQSFFKHRTVLIIAHRLSTVKNADKIVVLDSGKVVEVGVHEQLISMRGYYYRLVKNQLELGD